MGTSSVYMNAAAERLTGYAFAETSGRPARRRIIRGPTAPPIRFGNARSTAPSPRTTGTREEVFVHKDGTHYPVAFTASAIRDRGRTVGTIIEVRDIRGEKAAQERQRLLTHELNHRVKNTLAVMQSVASMTARFTPEPEAFRKAFSARLIAIARVHDILTRGAWSGATLAEVVEVTLAPYRARGASAVEVRGADVTLDGIGPGLQHGATNSPRTPPSTGRCRCPAVARTSNGASSTARACSS